MDRKCQQLAQTIQKVKNNKKVVVFDFDDTFAITELHIGFSEMVLFGDNARKRCLFNLLVQSTKFNVDVIIYTNNSLLDDILTKTTEFLNYCNSYYKKNYPRSDFTDITISKNLSDYGIRIINHATISGNDKVWPAKSLMINALSEIYDHVLFADDQVVNFKGIRQDNVTTIRAPIGGLTHTQLDEITIWVEGDFCKYSISI